jgi:hypothetical protein
MVWNGIPVVDGDGHVMEDWDSLLQYMPEPYIKSGRFRGRIFPPLDHLHSASLFELVPGAFRQVGVDGWLEFMDDVGIERAVLYTTGGCFRKSHYRGVRYRRGARLEQLVP